MKYAVWPERSILTVSLGVLIVGLLLIGLFSGTFVRHIVQAIPAVVALAGVLGKKSWASCAALPILIVWFLIMVAVWLTVTGTAEVAPGRYSPSEIVLTVVLALACLAGGYRSMTSGSPRPVVLVVFGVFQLLTFMTSFVDVLAYD